jgi:S1-C subfamily serine protease
MKLDLRRSRQLPVVAGLVLVLAALGAAFEYSGAATPPLWSEQPVAVAPAPVTAPNWVALAQTLKPAVVNVSMKRVAQAAPENVDPFFQQFFGRVPPKVQHGLGSGFVINADGYVVTNNHVVEDVRDPNAGASFDVVFSDNRKVSAKLVGRDPQTDVAVLQVAAQSLKAAALGNSDDAPVGASVVAIGSPLGEFQNTVTHGVLSAKGRRVAETQDIFLEDLLQTDAAINEGNSGGPLIWVATHQVIGMNTLVASNATGLGFAISSNTVRTIADELIRNGKIVRGFIGIQYQQLSPRQGAQIGLPGGTAGIIVTQVVSNSPAQQAGLRPNDIITKVNDQRLDAEHPLVSVMVKFRPGDKVTLTLIRDSKQQTVELTLGQPQR